MSEENNNNSEWKPRASRRRPVKRDSWQKLAERKMMDVPLSLDKVKFEVDDVSLSVTKVVEPKSSHSNYIFEMEVILTKGFIMWKVARSDLEFFEMHNKLVSIKAKSVVCPIKKSTKSKSKRTSKLENELNDPKVLENMKETIDAYCKQIISIGEVVCSPIFKHFLDPTIEPSAWFMVHNACLQSNLSLLRDIAYFGTEKIVFCALFGCQLYVFKEAWSDGPLMVIDLQTASVEVSSKQENVANIFELGVDRGKKLFLFKTKGGEQLSEWVVACRKARNKNLIVAKQLQIVLDNTNQETKEKEEEHEEEENVLSKFVNATLRRNATQKNTNMIVEDNGTNILDLITKDTAENTKYVNGILKGSTKSKLFEKLSTQDIQKLSYLYSFPLFTTSSELIEKMSNWIKPESALSPNSMERPGRRKELEAQANLLDFLLTWVQEIPHDLLKDENALKKIKEMNVFPPERLNQLLKNKGTMAKTTVQPVLPSLFGNDKFDTFDIHPSEISRQIALKAYPIWSKIDPREFLYWNDKERDKKCPNIIKLIENFNEINYMTCNFILSGSSPKQRGYFIMYMIETAYESFSLQCNNYHATVSILAALDSTPVSRLKQSWVFVELKFRQYLDTLKDYFSPTQNWKKYRELIQQTQPPCIPYIGLSLQDIVFIDDGNPDLLENNLINWDKCEKFASTIKDLRKFQNCAYGFLPVPILQEHLDKCKTTLTEKEFYKLSITVEPREQIK